MNGFERRKQRKKESILQAALELFRRYGFSKVSVDDIAEKAMVSKATIYNHFSSKEELTREVIKTLYMSQLEKYRDVIKSDLPFQEKLEYVVFDKSNLMSQYQGELVQNFNDVEIQQFIQTVWQNEIARLLSDFFDEGKRQGHIDPELSPESILLCFEVFLKGTFASTERIERSKDSAKLMKDLISILQHGLERKSG